MTTNIEILNGPSREELFDGLRLFGEKRLVPFLIKKDDRERYVAVKINSIEALSDQSWIITLWINKKCIEPSYFLHHKQEEGGVISKKVSGVIRKKVSFELFRKLAEEKYLLQEFQKDLIVIKVHFSTKSRKGYIMQ